jgi:2-keto-4-pentenoate hydratase/2-oxohepta-3-ene-1,7-dioic acid hydratase in catechol pathway
MKIVAYDSASGPRYGFVEGDLVREAGESLVHLRPGRTVGLLSGVELLPPIPFPSKIICVGKNYRKGSDAQAGSLRTRPVLFSKLSSAVIGSGQPIRLHRICNEVIFEAELAVVIGRRASAVDEAEALDCVLGYTCLNDVSARDLQDSDGQWMRAKSLDTFCPMGPWIVTRDEVPDPQSLRICSRRNEQLIQDASTSGMLYSVAELISYLSEAITLEPGDIISTGTPPNVPTLGGVPRVLAPGDVVQVEIERVGILENSVKPA